MADDKPEDAGLASDAGRARRTPPTIDLEATDVSTQPQRAADEAQAQPESAQDGGDQLKGEDARDAEASETVHPDAPEPQAVETPTAAAPISPWVVAPFSGAVAAAVVIAVGWMLGWPAVQAPPAAPQVTSASIDALNGRVAALEARAGKSVADPAITSRLDALDKSVASLRSDLANLKAQADRIVTPGETRPSAVTSASELAAINDRLAQLERATKADRVELAQQNEKIADNKPVDDRPLRIVVAAALLDVAVRHGDSYASQFAAARALAAKPEVLKPLETFAGSGLPTPVALCRELLTIVPKLTPPAEAQAGGGLVERLQAGASKLVRIERTDGAGTDRGAVVARVTAAAVRNDFTEARRELKTLPEPDRAPAQAWLDKADARDAALAAARKFADDAMADLAKPAP